LLCQWLPLYIHVAFSLVTKDTVRVAPGTLKEPEDGGQGAAEKDQTEESGKDDHSLVLKESRQNDRPPVPELIGGRFEVQQKIGSGSYSQVYLGIDTATRHEVAIKAEWKGAKKTDRLEPEMMLYRELGQSDAVPAIHWFGVEGDYRLLVMDMLGPSLNDILKEYKRFSLRTTLLLANQMLERLESVHDRGILFRDIKPHNFLLGRGEMKDRVYIVDFGLSKRYRSENGTHIGMTWQEGPRPGTVRYKSIRTHQGYEGSRRDDLEEIGYVLMYFLSGTLPWKGIKDEDVVRRKKVKTTNGTGGELFRGHPQEFADYLWYCRGLDFEERPDYAMLRGKFHNLYMAQGFDAAGWRLQFDDVLEAPSSYSDHTEM